MPTIVNLPCSILIVSFILSGVVNYACLVNNFCASLSNIHCRAINEIHQLVAAIAENSDISEREMYQDFNMGHRMEIYCSEADAEFMIGTAGKKLSIAIPTGPSALPRNPKTIVGMAAKS